MFICLHCSAHVSRARTCADYTFQGAWWQIMINDDQYFLTGGMYYKVSKKTQKWPNMAGLSTFQSGPKGSKRVRNGKPRCFWKFWTFLGLSGHFWTISDKNQFLFEMVQKGPDGPKMVPNGQKHLGWPLWSLSDPFGPLWSVDKPAMFGPFWSKMDHF